MPTHTPTDADLRWQYRLTGWADRGITYDAALESPELRAALALGAAIRHRRRARAESLNQGAGIERSHPDNTTR